MSQLMIQTPGTATRGARRRPMRTERMVGLRSSLPVGLVTLRHDVPVYVKRNQDVQEIDTANHKDTTSKVDNAERAQHAGVETPARKGGEAQW